MWLGTKLLNSTLKTKLVILPNIFQTNTFMTPLFCMYIYISGTHTFVPLDYWNEAIGTDLVFNYYATGGLLSGLLNLL